VEISEGTDPLDNSSTPLDTDGDLVPDSTDADDDNDGYQDVIDDFPTDPDEWSDFDNDGIGDNADDDDDNDGVPDNDDFDPQNPNIKYDSDGDGWGDSIDAFPNDPSEWLDSDGDGIGDNSDPDPYNAHPFPSIQYYIGKKAYDGEIVYVTLRVSGKAWQQVDMTVTDDLGTLIDKVSIIRQTGSPDEQSRFIEVQIMENRVYTINVTYQSNARGASPTWVIIDYDTSEARLKKTFNANKGEIQTWIINLNEVLESNPAFAGRVLFDASNSIDLDGSIISYKWDFGDGTLAIGKTIAHTYLKKGSYEVMLTVTDDKGASSTDNVTITIEEVTIVKEEEEGIEAGQVAAGAVAGAVVGVAVAGIILSSEFIMFALFSLFMPLYFKLRKEDLMKSEVRGMIRGYVRVHPGTHYSQIKSSLDLPNGTLMYHLHKMEKQEILHSKRDGRYKRFYPYGMKSSERPILTDFQEDIIETINETPGISKAEIGYLFDRNRQDVNHNVNVLADKGLVRIKKVRGKTHLYIADGEMTQEEAEAYKRVSKKREAELEGVEEDEEEYEEGGENEEPEEGNETEDGDTEENEDYTGDEEPSEEEETDREYEDSEEDKQ
ncbi:MAG: PKD domain-containing protein, partial [Thermoplasmata archaeon]